MTLGEGKTLVYMLLDEHSAGGEIEHDADLEMKMTWYFDIAQRLVSQVARIVRVKVVHPEEGRGEYAMPRDFRSVYRIRADGKPATARYHWRRGRLIVPQGDGVREIEVEYFAQPAAIAPDAPDDYEFELSEDACACLPFYVAAQQLLADPILDSGAMMAQFNLALGALSAALPGDNVRVGQTLYR